MDRDDAGKGWPGGGNGPPELMQTKVVGDPSPAIAPANPFVAPAPADPFAAPAPAPVNPFATPPEPQGVNPFAPSAPQAESPYRAQVPAATPPPVAAPRPMPGVPVLTNTRPLTILVACASGLYLIALLYATVVAASLREAKSIRDISAATAGLSSAELFHFFAVVVLAGLVIPWWIVTAGNCRKLCADKPRYSPHNAWTFLAPGLNMLVVGNAFEDMSKHSHERRGRIAKITRVFRFSILIALGLRLILLVVAMRGLTSMGGPMDAAFYVYGFGDPARFVYQTGPSLQGATVAVSLLSAAIPVLGVLSCFTIEKLQRETHRRLRSSAI